MRSLDTAGSVLPQIPATEAHEMGTSHIAWPGLDRRTGGPSVETMGPLCDSAVERPTSMERDGEELCVRQEMALIRRELYH